MSNEFNSSLNFERVQRSMLLRSIYLLVAPVMMLFAALACGTLVTDTASYTCPTAVPQATATTLAGTPMPTLPPPPTPYSISPPQDFYVGDAVFVGQSGAPLRLRFRLQNVQSQLAGSGNLVTWRLEIRNLGSATYETIPVALMVITRINTASGEQTGTWRTSEAAMAAAGFTNENYEPLPPGSTRVYRLAAYIPAGSVRQFTYLLDGEGGNRVTWVNDANPYCSGDVAD
ncbi:MAG: hypothetical protein L6Q98_16860 [Anaerolineae bacterium]|nr:hypothetical protein [Anaerolineae bacterium]NUQ03890.1 hypothetical protein [Anaerolineae bacterium]